MAKNDVIDIRVPVKENSTGFIDRLRFHIRSEGLAYTTEKAYISWIRRFIEPSITSQQKN